ncbi:MAG TPA: hypothetical protein VF789_18195 [Thermoanaerobaculia bacterium]
MSRFHICALVLLVAFAALAVPAAADKEEILRGIDYWRTPPGGTVFTFPSGDVESLCNADPSPTWNHQVSLRGVPTPGSDWDTAVQRLDNARFDRNGIALTQVRFRHISLASNAPSDTPCGKLNWTVRLAHGRQPIRPMRITRTSEEGGIFFANLALRVEFQATDAAGAPVGSLFYDVNLPDVPGGTPWSLRSDGVFRAGMDANDNCIQVLRDKLGTYPPGSQHIYFISNLIARGECKRPNG